MTRHFISEDMADAGWHGWRNDAGWLLVRRCHPDTGYVVELWEPGCSFPTTSTRFTFEQESIYGEATRFAWTLAELGRMERIELG